MTTGHASPLHPDPLLHQLIDTDAYPLHAPDSDAWQALVTATQQQLQGDGCSVLTGFMRSEVREQLIREGEQRAGDAYYTVETVNVYNTDPFQTYPDNHPAGIQFERGNAFVARDLIPTTDLIHQLYPHPAFKQFLAACFDTEVLYELADPLAGLCLNVLQPQREHPWHFDTNEFTVSLLTKSAESGGEFQYCPNIRSPEHENTEGVFDVISERTPERIRTLQLQCGDLQLFKGRYSLHRVNQVTGTQDRHTAIFAYTPLPDVIGSVERTRQLFGRVLPAHHAAEQAANRADTLLD